MKWIKRCVCIGQNIFVKNQSISVPSVRDTVCITTKNPKWRDHISLIALLCFEIIAWISMLSDLYTAVSAACKIRNNSLSSHDISKVIVMFLFGLNTMTCAALESCVTVCISGHWVDTGWSAYIVTLPISVSYIKS